MLKKSLIVLAVTAKAALLAMAVATPLMNPEATSDDANLCCYPPPCYPGDPTCDDES